MKHKHFQIGISILFAVFFAFSLSACASSKAASAEEYFSLGMAYFELGQAASDSNTRVKYFLESEKWFERASSIDKTQNASEYNLGRLAFETGRFQDAARQFEKILKKDPDNILALRAAAYTRIKTGDIELAEKHYNKLLTLVPESADSGYNYALVLYTMEKYEQAEQVLLKNQFALLDNSNSLLLYARTQNKLDRIEAVDTYARWLTDNKNAKVRAEYAEILENREFYAKALEEYREALKEITDANKEIKKADVIFCIARVILIADSENKEGISELEKAVKEGFADLEKLKNLADDKRLSEENRSVINRIINDIKEKTKEKEPAAPAVSKRSSEDSPAEESEPESE